jgi:hypothetical protein
MLTSEKFTGLISFRGAAVSPLQEVNDKASVRASGTHRRALFMAVSVMGYFSGFALIWAWEILMMKSPIFSRAFTTSI